jgi:hypothetical protein
VGDTDLAIDRALALNSQPGMNVYVGAALRHEDVFPGRTASDDDFLASYAVFVDADTPEQLQSAREGYRRSGMEPPLVVVTGRHPNVRAQMWWPLEEPVTDVETQRGLLRLLCKTLGTDPKVCTGKQLMRLGGSISWPKVGKEGRQIELTEVIEVKRAFGTFYPEQIENGCGGKIGQHMALSSSAAPPPVVVEEVGALGMTVEKLADGREDYAWRLTRGALHEMIGTTGCEVSAQELYEAVAPIYFRKIVRSPERDERFLMEKCRAAVSQFQRGMIPFMRDLEHAVATYQERVADGTFRPAAEINADVEIIATSGAPASQAAPATPRPIVAQRYQWVEPSRIPPRDILYGRHYFRKFIGTTVAPGGLGKSSLILAEALAMVTGQPILGDEPKHPLGVWYWNGEDPMEELQRRVAATCLHYRIRPEHLGDRLYVNSGRDSEIIVAREERNGLTICTPVVDAIVDQIRDLKIDVLIIDPFVASHRVNENDNQLIESVMQQWLRVAEEGHCAVELVHHVRKSQTGGETTAEDGRGAAALLAKVRSARVLNAMSGQEADEIGIERRDRFRFFRVDNGKANLMPRGGDAAWHQMIGVPLGNRIDAQEDEIGVVVRWERPGAFEGISAGHLDAVQRLVSEADWRESDRSPEWVGVAVCQAFGLNPDDREARQRVRGMIRHWIAQGNLTVVERTDAARKVRKFVVVGDGF